MLYSAFRQFRVCALVAAAALLAGCGGLGFPGAYKISIPQGNIITQSMVNQLREGMTKSQVQFVMGTPLIQDPFHQDRWDYVYSFQPGGGVRSQEQVTVFFEDDQLVRIEGDFAPDSDAPPAAPK